MGVSGIPAIALLARTKSGLRNAACGVLAILGFSVSAACADDPDSASVSSDGGGPAYLDFGLRGTVRDAKGRPIAGALLVPRALPGTQARIPEIGVKTSLSGAFAWPLPPGRFMLSVMIEGEVRDSVRVESYEHRVTTVEIVIK